MNTLFHLVLVLSLVSSFIRYEGILFSLFNLSDVFWLRNLNFIVFALLFAERVTVAEEVLKLCNGSVISPIACIACPNLYAYLKVIHYSSFNFFFSMFNWVQMLLICDKSARLMFLIKCLILSVNIDVYYY
ncbi:hypothetical protein AHAS_Ahas15G0309300 [Arachis hypogaea]